MKKPGDAAVQGLESRLLLRHLCTIHTIFDCLLSCMFFTGVEEKLTVRGFYSSQSRLVLHLSVRK